MFVSRKVGAKRQPRYLAFGSALFVSGVALLGGSLAPAFAAGEEASTAETPVIVGLGDSYASGVGASAVDTASGVCGRATNSFPLEAARALGGKGVNAACSGAPISALSDTYNGQAPQATKVANAKYAVISLGAGDVMAPNKAIETLTGGEAQLDTAALTQGLSADIEAVKQASPNTQVLVMGYPKPLPAAASETCPAEILQDVPEGELEAFFTTFNDSFKAMNGAIRTAAEQSGATYVNVKAPFEGHDLCSQDSFFNGFEDETTAGHPNDAGYAAMSQLTVDAVKQLRANKAAASGAQDSSGEEEEVLGSSGEEATGEEELAFTGSETPIGIGIGSTMMSLGLGMIWLRLRREEQAQLFG